jgi:hypothetical protein
MAEISAILQTKKWPSAAAMAYGDQRRIWRNGENGASK